MAAGGLAVAAGAAAVSGAAAAGQRVVAASGGGAGAIADGAGNIMSKVGVIGTNALVPSGLGLPPKIRVQGFLQRSPKVRAQLGVHPEKTNSPTARKHHVQGGFEVSSA